jgi:hypothetical protein
MGQEVWAFTSVAIDQLVSIYAFAIIATTFLIPGKKRVSVSVFSCC